MNESFVCTPLIVEKGWGREVVITNNQQYCAKVLEFKEGHKGSMHFHLKKDEVWYVLSGKIKVTTIDPSSAKLESKVFGPEVVIRLLPGVVHQVEAVTDSSILEASTFHSDDDVYRIAPGDSQK